MVTDGVRSLWAEPRAPGATGPATRDWVLVAATVAAAAVEALFRPDVAWRPLAFAVVASLASTLPWRRTHPLAVTVLAVGTSSAVDAVALARGSQAEALGSAVVFLLLPYAVARWGSGREVAAGLAAFAVPLALTAARGDPASDIAGGAVVLLLATALGAGVRYQRVARRQALDGVRSRERAQLARELHDSVAHHVSAIAIQAQAGRAVAASRPGAAADALAVIEEEASRTLEEMRTIVAALRDGDRAELVPQQGVADIERLARPAREGAGRVEVELTGDLDGLRPPVGAALYRIAQEAITNAARHARHARLVRVRLRGEADHVRLTVDDDGDGGDGRPGLGYGLVGMAERAKLVGGTFEAGPAPTGGWVVEAVLPRRGTRT